MRVLLSKKKRWPLLHAAYDGPWERAEAGKALCHIRLLHSPFTAFAFGGHMQWRYMTSYPIEILTSSYMSYGLWGALGALSSSLAAFH